MFFRLLQCLVWIIISSIALGAQPKTEKIVLVTVDGLRWQEVFRGPDKNLFDPEKQGTLMKRFQQATAEGRRRALFPFFWQEFIPKGVILGNKSLGSEVKVANPYRFSYPGYAEILLGRVLPGIDSNDKVYSPAPTVLEFVRHRFRLNPGDVAAFASWDVFEFICESQPGTIFVNAGIRAVPAGLVTEAMEQPNRLQAEVLTPWDSVRHDGLTAELALQYLKAYRPKVLYVALDETDDWAHNGRYDRYLQSALFFDQFLSRLWDVLQSLRDYRDKTTVLVTVDHGRGSGKEDWTDHGEEVADSENVWLAVRGPDTPALGEARNTKMVFSKNIAATLLALLAVDYRDFATQAGEPIEIVLGTGTN